MKENTSPHRVLACGIFNDEAAASRAVGKLIDDDFPMDQLSLLHRSGGSGDDMLGLAFTNTEERVKVWGEQGAAWGALWGLLAGATGLFMLPGIGPLLAAGPVVEALGGAIAGAALTGAALTGGAMAGAAALTQLAAALHRIGVPDADIELIHDAIQQGCYAVILHCKPEQSEQCAMRLGWAGADPVVIMPVRH